MSNKHVWTNHQQNRLVDMAMAGESAKKIAFTIGVTEKQAADKICSLRRNGLDIPYRSTKRPWPQEEREAFIRMWNDGVSTDEIAKALGRTVKMITAKASRLRGKGLQIEPKKRMTTPKRVLPARVVTQYVCSYSGVSKQALESRSTKRKTVNFRHIVLALCYRYSGNSMQSIGRMFGGRHHSTVFESIKIAAKKFPREMAEIESQMFPMKVAAE